MKLVTNTGNMPHILRSFLTGILSGENQNAEVFDCDYNEIISKATVEKLEPQVIIDKKSGTDRAYLCCVGASVRNSLIYDSEVAVKPIFYFAELDEYRKKEFQASIREARAKVLKDHQAKIARDKLIKENTRLAGDEYRGKIGTNK